jgi:hypothetical protein
MNKNKVAFGVRLYVYSDKLMQQDVEIEYYY